MAKSSSALASLSAADLAAELRRREKGVNKLLRQRERLAAKVNDLNQQIAALGGAAAGHGMGVRRSRPKNDSSLADAVAAVLDGKTMSVAEVTDAVQKTGYQTTSRNLRTIVNQTLLRNTKRFKRVARGQYTAK